MSRPLSTAHLYLGAARPSQRQAFLRKCTHARIQSPRVSKKYQDMFYCAFFVQKQRRNILFILGFVFIRCLAHLYMFVFLSLTWAHIC